MAAYFIRSAIKGPNTSTTKCKLQSIL